MKSKWHGQRAGALSWGFIYSFFGLTRKDGEIGAVCRFIMQNCGFVYAGKWEQARLMDF